MGQLMNFDELFSQEAASDTAIQELSVKECIPYHNHKFNVKRSDYDGLIESIRECGVLQPIIVRTYKGKYEILIGHRRHQASIDAGKDTIRAIVKELSDDEAWLIVSESNMFQSSIDDNKPSEIAEIIADYHAALKANGNKSKIISAVDSVKNYDNDDNVSGRLTDIVGEHFKFSARSISRFLRVNCLILELKAELDKGKLSMRAAVELSYINDEEQKNLVDMLCVNNAKCTAEAAKRLRDAFESDQLNSTSMYNILFGNEKERKSKTSGFKAMKDIYAKYFTNEAPDDVADIVDKALRQWFGC